MAERFAHLGVGLARSDAGAAQFPAQATHFAIKTYVRFPQYPNQWNRDSSPEVTVISGQVGAARFKIRLLRLATSDSETYIIDDLWSKEIFSAARLLSDCINVPAPLAFLPFKKSLFYDPDFGFVYSKPSDAVVDPNMPVIDDQRSGAGVSAGGIGSSAAIGIAVGVAFAICLLVAVVVGTVVVRRKRRERDAFAAADHRIKAFNDADQSRTNSLPSASVTPNTSARETLTTSTYATQNAAPFVTSTLSTTSMQSAASGVAHVDSNASMVSFSSYTASPHAELPSIVSAPTRAVYAERALPTPAPTPTSSNPKELVRKQSSRRHVGGDAGGDGAASNPKELARKK